MNDTRPPPRSDRTAWLVYAILSACVVLGLAVTESWSRFAGSNTGQETILDAVDLTGTSALSVFEWWVLLILGGLRTLALLRGARPLVPILDLPLLGFLIAATGGASSPLDPTLGLAYVAALVFLRGPEVAPRSRRVLAVQLLLGLLGLHLLVTQHDARRLAQREQRAEARIATQLDELRGTHTQAIESLSGALARLDAEASEGPLYGQLSAPLHEVQQTLHQVLLEQYALASEQELHFLGATLQAGLDDAFDRFFAARERYAEELRQGAVGASLQSDAESLELVRQSQWDIRQELRFDFEVVERERNALREIRRRQSDLRRSSMQRRAVIGTALLLFTWLALRLRDRLTAAVTRAEERRGRREIELREEERNNWIALTAGLTHGIGNDILAYDIYLGELEQALAAGRPGAREKELVGFLQDSNRGRMAFLQFLEAFARQHKAGPEQAAVAAPTTALDLKEILPRLRRQIAAVETADLPPAGSDPAVDRQLEKFRNLSLEVTENSKDAGLLRHSSRGVVEFCVYELVKNALRSATGERPLEVVLDRDERGVRLRLTNDVQVDRDQGPCPRCGRVGERRTVRRRRDRAAACEQCFPASLEELLQGSFEPGQGGGTGLGLFLIRYFLSSYARGGIVAGVEDAMIPTVYFEITFPDQPENTSTEPRT